MSKFLIIQLDLGLQNNSKILENLKQSITFNCKLIDNFILFCNELNQFNHKINHRPVRLQIGEPIKKNI